MKKIHIMLAVALLTGVGLALIIHGYNVSSQEVIVCVVETHTCTHYPENKIYAVGSDGSCIHTVKDGDMCRPAYQIYKKSNLDSDLKEACKSKLLGSYDSNKMKCTSQKDTYIFDMFRGYWIPTHN